MPSGGPSLAGTALDTLIQNWVSGGQVQYTSPHIVSVSATPGQTGATINKSINPNGNTAYYRVGYGLVSSSYSNYTSYTVTNNDGGGGASVSSRDTVGVNLTGLYCSTPYYYILQTYNSSNGIGSPVQSAEGSFTTTSCAAPTVTTDPESSKSATSVTLNATVNDNSGYGASAYYVFNWGITAGLGTATAHIATTGSTSDRSISANLTGLTCNTTYYFRVEGTNPGASSSGSTRSFTTSACGAPTTTTVAASSVTDNSATLKATVNDQNDASSSYAFSWGTSPTLAGATVTSAIGSAGTAVNRSISSVVTPSCGLTYYFKISGSNSGGSSTGSILSFNTYQCATAPVFNSITATAGQYQVSVSADVTDHLNQNFNNNLTPVDYDLQYGPTTSYDFTAPLNSTSNYLYAQDNHSFGPIHVTGLNCSATYHYRIRGNNSVGITYSPDATFATSACPGAPIVTTQAASSITQTAATLSASVNNNNDPTSGTYLFQYGTTNSLGTSTTGQSVSGSSTITANLSTLSCGTTYYFRVSGTNSVATTPGSILSFSTTNCPNTQTISMPTGGTMNAFTTGTNLLQGDTATGAGAASIAITTDDLGTQDPLYQPIGMLFDFKVTGVTSGQQTSIVLPLGISLPGHVVWRKFDGSIWKNFDTSAGDAVYSTAVISGGCPAANSSSWRTGLLAGANCVKLLIRDGGPNDTDNAANGTVVDPGGPALSRQELSSIGASSAAPTDSQSGGITDAWVLWLISLVAMRRIRGRR